MKIYAEKSLADFRPWSEAERTYDRIYNAGLLDHLEACLEAIYPDGIDETELNDLFSFEPEYLLGLCGIRTESEIQNELSYARSQLQDLLDDYASEEEDIEEESGVVDAEELLVMRQKLYDQYYRDDIDELEQTIADLERELSEF